MSPRTFPGPWRVDTTAGGHFVIRDANGFPLAYVYAKRKPTVNSEDLTPAEAMVIAEKAVNREDLICITGSFYLVADAKRFFATHPHRIGSTENP